MKIGAMASLLMLSMFAVACAEAEAPALEEPVVDPAGIEGTYRLMHRMLADGTRLTEPDVLGLATFANGHRNFNVYWRDRDGKVFSYSVISVYELSEAEYSEKILYSALHDEAADAEIVYQTYGAEAAVPVVREAEKIRIDLPFDPVTATFEGRRLTAESPEFVDTWERVD